MGDLYAFTGAEPSPPPVTRERPTARPRGYRAAWALGVGVAAASLLTAGCSSSSSSSASGATNGSNTSGNLSGTVIVFAAASLNGAFDKIGGQFEQAHPGVALKFNYGGSSSLATSLTQGAKADVFASANTKNMETVQSADLVSGTPANFAQNKLEIAVIKGNPMHIGSVSDLSKNGVKVAVCQEDVPCGSYSADVFKKADVTVKPVTEETSVTGVVTKVSLGEADAGVVYTTDVKAAGDKVTGVPIPDDLNVTANYPIAQLKDAPNAAAAKAFESYVLSPEGQTVLHSYGFLPAGG
jgi:molybdate transport system substrate-binding protein